MTDNTKTCSCKKLQRYDLSVVEEEHVNKTIPVHFRAKIYAIQNVNERVGTVKVVARSYLFWNDRDGILRESFKDHEKRKEHGRILKALDIGIAKKLERDELYYFPMKEWPPGVAEYIPSLDLYGTQDRVSMDASEFELRFLEHGYCMLTQLHHTTIVVNFELNQFPFDTNNVKLKFWLRKTKDKKRFFLLPCCCEFLKVKEDENLIKNQFITYSTSVTAGSSGFKKLDGCVIREESLSENQNDPQFRLCNLVFLVPLKRKARPWIFRYAAPPMLVAILAASSSAVPYWNFWDRASVNLALLLTLFTMHISHTQELPKMSYMTPIDMVFMFSILLIWLITFENWILAKFYGCGQELNCMGGNLTLDQESIDRIQTIDAWLYIGIMGIWVLCIFGLILRIWYKIRLRSKPKINKINEDSVNSTSILIPSREP